jgi:hypothetical protein
LLTVSVGNKNGHESINISCRGVRIEFYYVWMLQDHGINSREYDTCEFVGKMHIEQLRNQLQNINILVKAGATRSPSHVVRP